MNPEALNTNKNLEQAPPYEINLRIYPNDDVQILR